MLLKDICIGFANAGSLESLVRTVKPEVNATTNNPSPGLSQ